MPDNSADMLHKLIKDHLGVPKHGVECGAWFPAYVRLKPYAKHAQFKLLLIEPQPSPATELERAFSKYSNVSVLRKAIHPTEKSVVLDIPWHSKLGKYPSSCAYVQGTESPLLSSRGPSWKIWDRVTAAAVPFSSVDDGTFDVAVLDMEGAEWLALQDMVSRPKIIAVEFYSVSGYVNPHRDEIMAWMDANGYVLTAAIEEDAFFLRMDGSVL